MSVRVTLNCQVKSDQFTVLIPFLAKNLPNVRGFDGCMSVAVYFDNVNSEMLLEEEWLSIEQHQVYLNTIKNNGVLAKLAAFLELDPVIKYFKKEYI